MTHLVDIIDSNDFDTNITTKPPVYYGQKRNISTVKRGIVCTLSATDDEIIGIIQRSHFNPDSTDAYICEIKAVTESDARDIIKAVKKVFANYSPTSDENVIKWEEGDWTIKTTIEHIFRMIVLIGKAGIPAY